MDILLNALQNFFLNSLDWPFIIGLMLFAYFVTRDEMVNNLPNKTKLFLLKIAKVYRVLFVGIIFGLLMYYVRGYNHEEVTIRRIRIESLMYSYFFATSFYELILAKILDRINLK